MEVKCEEPLVFMSRRDVQLSPDGGALDVGEPDPVHDEMIQKLQIYIYFSEPDLVQKAK